MPLLAQYLPHTPSGIVWRQHQNLRVNTNVIHFVAHDDNNAWTDECACDSNSVYDTKTKCQRHGSKREYCKENARKRSLLCGLNSIRHSNAGNQIDGAVGIISRTINILFSSHFFLFCFVWFFFIYFCSNPFLIGMCDENTAWILH